MEELLVALQMTSIIYTNQGTILVESAGVYVGISTVSRASFVGCSILVDV